MKKIITPMLVVMLAIVFACVFTNAQEQRFKIGDRVEIDTATAGDYPGSDKYANWRKGTVVRYNNPENRFGGYWVKTDDGQEWYFRFVDTRWIRAPQTPETKTADDKKLANQEKPNDVPNTEAKPVDQQQQNQTAGGNFQPNPPNDAKPDQPAANPTGEFKVGDRVETDVFQIGTSSPAEMQKWKKGTVTEIDRRPGYRPMYVVTVDPLPGQLAEVYRVPITPNATEKVWIRAAGGAAPKIETDKLRVDENDTVLADRETLNCQHLEEPAASNGQPLPVELAKKLVRCAMGENPSPPGGQGAKTVNITQFQVGAPRRWIPRSDTGTEANENTIVYPVRATFTSKAFHREQNIVVENREQTFRCFVDVGHWVCGPDQVFKEGQKKQIQVVK